MIIRLNCIFIGWSKVVFEIEYDIKVYLSMYIFYNNNLLPSFPIYIVYLDNYCFTKF